MLNRIAPILRPARKAGRLLFTRWDDIDRLPALAAFAEGLNCQAAIVTPDKEVSRAAASIGILAVTGDFLSSIEGSHYRAPRSVYV